MLISFWLYVWLHVWLLSASGGENAPLAVGVFRLESGYVLKGCCLPGCGLLSFLPLVSAVESDLTVSSELKMMAAVSEDIFDAISAEVC